MIGNLKSVYGKLGIDKAIGFTVLGRVVQGIGGVVSVYFISRYLTGIEQGFYYTFASILAIQIFFELGFGGIITQYVAHENSHLKWQEYQQVTGSTTHISRLASLLRFCLRWYPILAIALIVILIIVGGVFFTVFYQAGQDVNWTGPWLLLCLGTALNFLIAPTSAFLEGLGRVKEIAKYRFWAQLVMISITWGGLFLGAKLYVGGIASIVGALLFGGYIFLSYHRKTITTLLNVCITDRVNYRNEIFPFQWKIALSWISGFFIFQLFNPVLFATEGAVVAGQMGMTMAIANSILALSFSWITTKQPVFSGLIAQNQYEKLDTLFLNTFRQSTFINAFGLMCAFLAVAMLRYFHVTLNGHFFGDRFLDYLPMFFLLMSFLLNHIIGSWAVYLRCHKKEPLLIHSLCFGLSSALTIYLTATYFNVTVLTIAYFILSLIFTLWAYYIYKTKKQAWHYGE